MKIFGLSITKAARRETLHPVTAWDNARGGWWPVIVHDHYAGAWQRNDEIRIEDWLSFWPVFRCIDLISSDVSKCRLRLVSQDENGIWSEADSPAFSPVLRKPNGYQNRIQFVASWVQSKLIHGNAYVLKQRDQRGVVVRLHVLDPAHVTVLVAPNGDVYYELRRDDLAGLSGNDNVVAPAREIIHDRQDTFYHPLIGLSKMYAAGGPALQGLSIQKNETQFFGNRAMPGGILTAPGAMADDAVARMKSRWQENFGGANAGSVAVLADGLKFEPLAVKATDAQVVEQQKGAAEAICAAFGVPPYKLGLGPMPTANNVEALDQQYYSQCLQIFIEAIEMCLDEGLELPAPYGTEFDLDDLLRLDTATHVKSLSDAVGAGIMAPNEARRRLNLPPVNGGASPYLQQQNYSLAALAKRDQKADPFAPANPAPKPAEPDEPDEDGPPQDEEPDPTKTFMARLEQRVAEGWMGDATA